MVHIPAVRAIVERRQSFDAEVDIPDWFTKFVDGGGEMVDSGADFMTDYEEPPEDIESEIEFGADQNVPDADQRGHFGAESIMRKLRILDGDIEELKAIVQNHIDRRKYDMYF